MNHTSQSTAIFLNISHLNTNRITTSLIALPLPNRKHPFLFTLYRQFNFHHLYKFPFVKFPLLRQLHIFRENTCVVNNILILFCPSFSCTDIMIFILYSFFSSSIVHKLVHFHDIFLVIGFFNVGLWGTSSYISLFVSKVRKNGIR